MAFDNGTVPKGMILPRLDYKVMSVLSEILQAGRISNIYSSTR